METLALLSFFIGPTVAAVVVTYESSLSQVEYLDEAGRVYRTAKVLGINIRVYVK